MQTSDSIVIIPTYNERENIENIIRAVFALEHGFHILVIEDGSPDGTAAIVKDLQREFPNRLFMVERKGKLGLGTAYIAGLNGLCNATTNIYSKWMPISAITPKTCPASTGLVRRGSGCGHRLALRQRRECGKLAYGTCADVLFRFQICTVYHGIAHT